MVFEDLLNFSDNQLKSIYKDLLNSKSILSDAMKIELDVLYRIIEHKVTLSLEENYLTLHLYFIMVNLQEEIELREREQMKGTNKSMSHSEIIFKNLLTSFLTNRSNTSFENFFVEDEDEIDLEKNDYKALKRKNWDDLVFKSDYYPEKKFQFNLSKEFRNFEYEEEKKKYSWVKIY